MIFHRQPKDSKRDVAEDVRDFVKSYSDDKAKLETLERLSKSDLVVLMLAFQDMKNRWHRDMAVS